MHLEIHLKLFHIFCCIRKRSRAVRIDHHPDTICMLPISLLFY